MEGEDRLEPLASDEPRMRPSASGMFIKHSASTRSFRRMSTVSTSVRRNLRRMSAISGDSGIQRRGSYVWPSGEEDFSMNLKPKVTLLNGITIIVGGIIGSGIFISPKGVTEYTGSVGLSLAVWLGYAGVKIIKELGWAINKKDASNTVMHCGCASLKRVCRPNVAGLNLKSPARLTETPGAICLAMNSQFLGHRDNLILKYYTGKYH
ncbi:hypothetical protein CAPTEDRAFT_188922 [Capitella teleta]|uniref:Amino acid permease/ SLC12A domain-containing protein n=1 Tax=Capitella teleta TaxID=283909 RepID=R7UAG9_CAPTE|nr:hypothetical protein CAPTEDRAFT_188922 [Capitella teleta]|eukprot:ELU00813.1 hypothetical protein CAPTEDRAFT_188922 [Capitella teleta]